MSDENLNFGNLKSELQPFINQGQSGLLPALLYIQDKHDFISEPIIGEMANLFNLSKAEVFGVKSFYHDLHDEKPGKHTIKICRAEACLANGSRNIEALAEQQLGTKFDTTTSNGFISLKSIYCLGTCAHGPTAMVNGKIHLRVTEKKLKNIIENLKKVSAE
ncbi:MAG: NADH-quinone oxidoreductase subunit NuoE family protein [Sphingomonadales bacterium]